MECSGGHTVYRDVAPQTDYAAPHWLDDNLDGDADDPGDHRYPYAYTRATTMTATTRWRVEPAAAFAGKTFWVTGDGPGALDIPWTTGPIAGGIITVTRPFAASFPNAIDMHDPFGVNWSMQVWDPYPLRFYAGASGHSENPIYVTLGNPQTTLFHTLVRIGCSRAAGHTQTTPTAQAIWGEFTDRIVQRVDNPTTLTYWGGGSASAVNTAELLRDGNGQCGAWAEFLRDCWRAQGIGTGMKIGVDPLPPSEALLVKNWIFNGTGISSTTVPYCYVVNTDVFSTTGVAGQNNPNPPDAFYNHFIVRYGSAIYDPSYGIPSSSGGFASQALWETAALDGLTSSGVFRGNPVDFAKREDPNVIETTFTSLP